MYVSFLSPACMHICLYVCIHACMHAGQMMTNVGHASWKQYSCSTAKGGSSEKNISLTLVVWDQSMAVLLQHQWWHSCSITTWHQCSCSTGANPMVMGHQHSCSFWWPLRSWRHMQLRDIQSVAAWAIQRKKHRKKQSKINQRPYLCSYC